MALIECPDCGRQVSDSAATCIGCGRPLHADHDDDHTVLIEQSSKGWKSLILTGLAFVVVGFVVTGVAKSDGGSAVGGLLILVGAVTFVFSVIGRWWNHG